jgi:hypothetical protein
MPDLPELPLDFPDPQDETGSTADAGESATAAASASELVDAIETLDNLLDKRGETLLDDPESDDDDDGPEATLEIPLLLDVVRLQDDMMSLSEPSADCQGSFEEMDSSTASDQPVAADGGSLQSQLIDELRQIIDDGLNRVAETTRVAVAQELKSQREEPPLLPTSSETREVLPSEMRTLAQAVDDALVKCGIDLGSHEALYGDLLCELNAILRGGLELIRRNMETAVRNRLQRHAEHTLRGLRELRADQQQELPWPPSSGETPAARPPTLEPYPDNGDNPGRPG